MKKVKATLVGDQEVISLNYRRGRGQQRPPYTAENLRISCFQHAQDLRDAFHEYGPPLGMPMRRALDLISHRRALELRYMNPHARPIWQHYLRKAFGDWGVETAPDVRMITLINDLWHFDERTWDFDLDRMKRQIRSLLAGCNYVVSIEFAYFCNHLLAVGSGQVVAPHVQGLIWGETPGLRERCAQLVPGLAGADPLHLLAIREAAGGFAGAVGYMVKPPYHGYSVWKDMRGRIHHQGKALALKRHHYLFTHLLPYDYPDLFLSGGEGVAVLRTARAAADRPFRRSRR